MLEWYVYDSAWITHSNVVYVQIPKSLNFTSTLGDHIKTFAYLNIGMSEKNFRKCKYGLLLSSTDGFIYLFSFAN